MSIVALEVIAAFDALPDADRDIVAAELLARYPVGVGELPDDAFVKVANEVFLMFDAAEDELPHYGRDDAASV